VSQNGREGTPDPRRDSHAVRKRTPPSRALPTRLREQGYGPGDTRTPLPARHLGCPLLRPAPSCSSCAADRIAAMNCFLDRETLFPRFGLPPERPA